MGNSILVFGANGLVGRSVRKQVENKYNFYGTYFKRKENGLLKADITSNEDMLNVFKKANPDFTINCSNLAGGVNFCEKEPIIAKKFHLQPNQKMGELCEKYNSRFVLISTDYVFDGEKPPYKEDDPKNPLNTYGKLKLEAENWIIDNVSKYTIVRTTNVFGWDPKTVTPNYLMQLYMTIKENKQFNAPSFLWGNPTYVDDLSSAIIELCEKALDGIYHVVGSSFINRYDWAIKACEKTGWDKNLIKEKKDIPENIVPRPLKSHLSTEKFQRYCKTQLHNVDEGLDLFIKNMKKE